MYGQALKRYRQVDLESAPKTQILDKLYGRFQRDVDDAKAAIADGDVKARTAAIEHASLIVIELVAALDHGVAPELCANREALYDFVQNRLSRANAENEPAPLDEAAHIMSDLRGAFQQAAAQQ